MTRFVRDALAGILPPFIAVIGFSSQALSLQTPSFEVASVKQNNDRSVRPALRYTPSGVDFAGVPLTWIIGEAYQLPYYSPTAIVATDNTVRELLSPASRYDISARVDSAASRTVIREMLQSLLIERFKLALHHEPKDESVYKLIVARNGPRLRKSADQSEVGQPVIASSSTSYDFRHVEMARLAGFMSSLLDRPVVDSTGLQGFYDFELKRETAPPQEEALLQEKPAVTRNAISSSIFAGIESELGLRLEPAKAPVDHVVIDHLEKPSEN
jgi:uncharacterized protein (TIGR03435 family)